MTIDDAQADYVSRTRWENAARNKSGGKKIRHLADGLVGRHYERNGNAETAVGSWVPQPNEHLIGHQIESPVAAFKLTRIEVGEAIVVVPKAGLVIAQEASIARQAVGLIRNLADCEDRPIHRKIHAVFTVVAERRVAIVHAAHDVGPRGRSYFDKSSPGVSGIGGRTGGVDENAFWVAIEAILYEDIVVGRD